MNTTNVAAQTSKGLSTMIQTVLVSLAKADPSKEYTANEVHTEILRRNPGFTVQQAKLMQIEVAKRLSTMHKHSIIKRTVKGKSRYAYIPASLDLTRCNSTKGAVTKTEVTVMPVAKSSKIDQVKTLISSLSITELAEIISLASNTLTAQVETKEARLKDKITQLIKNI